MDKNRLPKCDTSHVVHFPKSFHQVAFGRGIGATEYELIKHALAGKAGTVFIDFEPEPCETLEIVAIKDAGPMKISDLVTAIIIEIRPADSKLLPVCEGGWPSIRAVDVRRTEAVP